MIILHVIVGLGVGGAELMLKRLVLANLGSKEFTHHVISLTDLGKIGEDLAANGVQVKCLKMRSPLGVFRVLWQLIALMKKLRPDIVHTWMYHSDLLGGLAARFVGGSKLIWSIRTSDISRSSGRATRFVRWICATISDWVPDTILSVGDRARAAHIAVGYAARRMQVIPNGFETEHFQGNAVRRKQYRNEFGFLESEIVIGSVGRYHPVKDHLNFVRAAGLVLRNNPRTRFCLIGRGVDDHNAELVRAVADTGFVANFSLCGERDDIAGCLNAFDIFCLHSINEGFPNALGEALATGLPCVSTDVGDAQTMLGPALRAVPSGDPAILARSIEAMLLLDHDARKAHGDSGRARICETYSLKKICEQYENLYRNSHG